MIWFTRRWLRTGGVMLVLGLPLCTTAADTTQSSDGKSRTNINLDLGPSVQRYQDEIADLERELGPFDPRLGEQLLSLGLVYKGLGRYEDARDLLTRALHITRVNEGLHSMAQVPVLQDLISVNIAAKNWDALDQNYHQLLWVHKRNFDPGDPTLLPIVDTVGRWKISAYKNALLSDKPMMVIRDADILYRTNIAIMEGMYGEHDPRLIEPLYGLALTSYQLLIEALNAPVESFQATGSRTRSQMICRTVVTPQGPVPVCNVIQVPDPSYYISQQQNKDMALLGRLRAAKTALDQVVAIHEAHPELPAAKHAEALVHVGDWYLLSGKRTSAIRTYKQAYDLLSRTEDGQEKLQRLFGKPTRLPALSLPLPRVEKEIKNEQKASYVQVEFEVTERGKPRNVEVIGQSDPDNVGARRRAKQQVKETTFRPRFENGEPSKSKRMVMRVIGAS